jgi:hypothetical protein
MDKVIRFKVKKDLDNKQHQSLLRLKGGIIAKGYTDIIHISDEGEEFHINSFSVLPEQKAVILKYITHYLDENNLNQTIIPI